MLKKIKSIYFSRNLFSILEDKIKLGVVKYNKNFQEILNINLTNYKILSGKYIQFENDGKVKEFNAYNDIMTFEGEYLNGKRHGKGNEYDDFYGYLIYEGEYLNGKRHGKGIEYNIDCYLQFEGEFFEGKKWNGKGYDTNKENVYNLKNGKGFVKEYDTYSFHLIFEGEYVNGVRNGKGKEYYNDKVIFEGEYINGEKWNGISYNDKYGIVFVLKNGKGMVQEYDKESLYLYIGQYLNRKRHGKAFEFFDDKIMFVGEYINGKRHGKGKEEFYDGVDFIYEGDYFYGKKHGKGKEYGVRYNFLFEGEFLYNKKFKGKNYINGILEYEGEYLYDKKWNGKGYDENHNIIYEIINGNGKIREYLDDRLINEGDYLNGKLHGKGKEYNYDNGELIYEGDYLNGKKNGKGKEYRKGEIIFEGEYLNDERWNGKGKEYESDFNDRITFEGEYINGEKIKNQTI